MSCCLESESAGEATMSQVLELFGDEYLSRYGDKMPEAQKAAIRRLRA